jgi:hypothetical protein
VAPEGPILGARVEHLLAKEALLADDPTVYFTTPHFDGYPAILVRLDRIGLEDLQELIVEAWLARAPRRLAKAYLDPSSDPLLLSRGSKSGFAARRPREGGDSLKTSR